MASHESSNRYKVVRPHNISIKVSDDELALIHLYASKKPHSSISDYVRDKALKHHARTIEIKEEDLEKLRQVFGETKSKAPIPVKEENIQLSKENELKIKIADQFLEIMKELEPKIAPNNGFVNYKEAGQQLLSLKSLSKNI